MSKVKISVVLPRLLKERGLNQTQLSKMANVSLSTISTWMLPKSKPRDPDAVYRVAEVLGVTLEELLFDTRPREREVTIEHLPQEKILDGVYRLRLERISLREEKGKK